MKKIEFFEPPMCCSTGICGPSVDGALVRLIENIERIKKEYPNVEVVRYMITQQPLKFRENEEVYRLIQDNSQKVLPITTVDGRVITTHRYPSLEELEQQIKG
ncbi:MAG: arsenite efflux transporter metallochaperone ArsD [Dethiobacter sp.]|jgi:hypothetical protein|nr:arsenite efflux transporter metallochaperone ArsD [Dethiobacter sp.]